MKELFLNNKFILFVIVLNTILIYSNGILPDSGWLRAADAIFTLFFLIEVIVKIASWSWHSYWIDSWNKFDLIIVVLALPSLFNLFVDDSFPANAIFVLRVMRVFKSFLIFRYIPNITKILRGIQLAVRTTLLVCIAFVVFLVVFSVVTSAIFAESAPQYFGTPLLSLYSIFRLFTIEGWYEMPEAVVANSGVAMGLFARLYFALLMFAGGIIGMSLINSIFVDAMVSDNNDEVLEKLDRIEKELNKLNNTK